MKKRGTMNQTKTMKTEAMTSYVIQNNVTQNSTMSDVRDQVLREQLFKTRGVTQPSRLSACIVVPTYNESGNIMKLLDTIFDYATEDEANGGNIDLSVLVVDDSSPDGTAVIVQEYAVRNSNVHLLLRTEKEGLGAAYIAGMQHAMDELDPDVVLEMDADFSHNPKNVFAMLQIIRGGADFVIGSRYIAGGSIPKNWGLHRRAISKAANLYTKIVLRIPKVKDCSGGFRAIRSDLLRRVDLSSLNVKGYAFQVLLLEAAVRAGADVRETPIHFHERNAGKSKMGLFDMLEGAVLLLRVGTTRFFKPAPVAHAPEKLYFSRSGRKFKNLERKGTERKPRPGPLIVNS